MSVRDATSKDSKRFLELWVVMLAEIYENYPKADSGPTRKNVNYHRMLFESYVGGFAKGVVMLWEPARVEDGEEPVQGLVMAGGAMEEGQGLDRRWESPAWIHGIYVAPAYRKYGGWRALHRAGSKGLRALNFTDVIGFVPADHAESFRMNTLSGGTPYAILMELSL